MLDSMNIHEYVVKHNELIQRMKSKLGHDVHELDVKPDPRIFKFPTNDDHEDDLIQFAGQNCSQSRKREAENHVNRRDLNEEPRIFKYPESDNEDDLIQFASQSSSQSRTGYPGNRVNGQDLNSEPNIFRYPESGDECDLFQFTNPSFSQSWKGESGNKVTGQLFVQDVKPESTKVVFAESEEEDDLFPCASVASSQRYQSELERNHEVQDLKQTPRAPLFPDSDDEGQEPLDDIFDAYDNMFSCQTLIPKHKPVSRQLFDDDHDEEEDDDDEGVQVALRSRSDDDVAQSNSTMSSKKALFSFFTS